MDEKMPPVEKQKSDLPEEVLNVLQHSVINESWESAEGETAALDILEKWLSAASTQADLEERIELIRNKAYERIGDEGAWAEESAIFKKLLVRQMLKKSNPDNSYQM